MSVKVDISTWESGRMISMMEKGFSSMLMDKGMKVTWPKDYGKEKELSITLMEECTEGAGMKTRRTGMESKKGNIITKGNG